MTNPNDFIYPNGPENYKNQGGLSKREYFAAMAMQGLLMGGRGQLGILESRRISEESCIMADLLIQKLNEPTQN